MQNLINTLIESAQKKRDNNGNPVYKIAIQAMLDQGYTVSSIKTAGKKLGARLVKNDSQISLQSYNLREDLNQLIQNMN